jgi:hypothetical protein
MAEARPIAKKSVQTMLAGRVNAKTERPRWTPLGWEERDDLARWKKKAVSGMMQVFVAAVFAMDAVADAAVFAGHAVDDA